MSNLSDIFTPWIERWSLVADGPRFESYSRSQLLPVLSGGKPAMLKVPTSEEAHRAAGLSMKRFVEEEAHRAAALLVWYGGDGAARVMARDGPVLLLERLTGDRDLATMACTGQDDEATRIVCDAIARLHTQRAGAPPELTPLPVYFRALETAACKHGGVLSKAAATAAELFTEPRETIPLHGDIHHRNILDGRERGWLAIDPVGLLGERGFDYANLFNNPDVDSAHDKELRVATAPGSLTRRLQIVADISFIERKRLLQWVLAFSGLSASWTLGSGGNPTVELTIAEIAAAALDT